MKRLSAIDVQERLRAQDVSVICVTRRRAPSVDEVVRRLDAATARAGLELFTIDGDDGETAALLPDLGVTAIPSVLVVASGMLLERVSTVRDGVDARRLVAMAVARRQTVPPGPAVPETLPPASALTNSASASKPPTSAASSSSPSLTPSARDD